MGGTDSPIDEDGPAAACYAISQIDVFLRLYGSQEEVFDLLFNYNNWHLVSI